MQANWILLICFISVTESCLVVRIKGCACQNRMLNRDNLSIVSDHPFYRNLSSSLITEPTVTGDNCSISIFCDGDFELVVLDKETMSNFGQYSADGICQTSSQTWLVTDDNGFKTFQVMNAVCVNFKGDQCTPETNTTFLFVYSNDIATEIMKDFLIYSDLSWRYNGVSSQFKTFGHIRIDVEQDEQIQYHSRVAGWLRSMNTTTPASSFADPSKGSDIIKAIEKHLSNTKAPVCGTRILVFMKRPLLEVDTLNIVQKLQKYHISLFALSFDLDVAKAQAMNNLAAQTDGYGTISNEKDPLYLMPFIERYYCIYASKSTIGGAESFILPRMTVPDGPMDYAMLWNAPINVEGTKIELRWNNSTVTNNGAMNPTEKNANFNTVRQLNTLDPVIYNMEFWTSFDNAISLEVNVRIYGSKPINYWVSQN